MSIEFDIGCVCVGVAMAGVRWPAVTLPFILIYKSYVVSVPLEQPQHTLALLTNT